MFKTPVGWGYIRDNTRTTRLYRDYNKPFGIYIQIKWRFFQEFTNVLPSFMLPGLNLALLTKEKVKLEKILKLKD